MQVTNNLNFLTIVKNLNISSSNASSFLIRLPKHLLNFLLKLLHSACTNILKGVYFALISQ